jgi:hypothetical protein
LNIRHVPARRPDGQHEILASEKHLIKEYFARFLIDLELLVLT